MEIIKNISQLFSFAVLLLVSTALGFVGKPTEMALSIVAGAFGLAFCNIERIAKFKGAGFEAEMRIIETAKTAIEAQTEPTLEKQQEAARKVTSLTDVETRVLASLLRPGYTWRYAKSVAREAQQTEEVTLDALARMRDRGLTDRGQGSNGEIWTATAVGRSAHLQSDPAKV